MQNNTYCGINYIERANTNAINMDMVDFVNTKLNNVLKMLGLKLNNYAIGGSLAAFCYGVNYGRVCKDIDIIVPEGTTREIAKEVNDSPFFDYVLNDEESYEYDGNHLIIKMAKGPILDFIECPFFKEITAYVPMLNVPLVCPDNLVGSKRYLGRDKDKEDLALFESVFIPKYNEKNLPSDKDALDMLKEKMGD